MTMNSFPIIIILLNLIWVSYGEPNKCCSNNMPFTKGGCINNATYWLREVKCRAYSVDTSDQDIQISEDDTLILSKNFVISREKYCMGTMLNENNTRLLICFPEQNQDTNHILIVTCMIITILSLILTLGIYLILPKLRDIHGKCIMFMVFSLLMSNIFLISVKRSSRYPPGLCYFLAASIYFWFLCTFFWMNIISFHIWKTITKPSFPENKKRIFKLYNIYGWGCPIIILIISNIAYHTPGNHIKPSWNISSCWFSVTDYHSHMLYFTIPIFILLSINLILFILSALSLRSQNTEEIDNKYRSRRYKFILYLKLFLTMGVCWIFEPIEYFLPFEFLSTLWLVTSIINALQGLIIFLLLIVFRKKVRRELARKKGICCKKLPEDWATMADEECEELSEES